MGTFSNAYKVKLAQAYILLKNKISRVYFGSLCKVFTEMKSDIRVPLSTVLKISF